MPNQILEKICATCGAPTQVEPIAVGAWAILGADDFVDATVCSFDVLHNVDESEIDLDDLQRAHSRVYRAKQSSSDSQCASYLVYYFTLLERAPEAVRQSLKKSQKSL